MDGGPAGIGIQARDRLIRKLLDELKKEPRQRVGTNQFEDVGVERRRAYALHE
jgi:hypothetical protein